MGRFFPKTLLTWSEPESTRRARHTVGRNARSPWGRLLAAAILFGFWMFLYGMSWLLRRLTPSRTDRSPLPAGVVVLVALVGTIFIVYGAPLLFLLAPTRIRILDQAILINDRYPPLRIPYGTIAQCRIVGGGDGPGRPPVLVISTTRGEDIAVGVESSLSLDTLEDVLRGRGVTVNRGD